MNEIVLLTKSISKIQLYKCINLINHIFIQEPVTIVDLGSDEAPSGYGTPVNSKSELKATNESDFIENMRAKMMEEVGGQVNAVFCYVRNIYNM